MLKIGSNEIVSVVIKFYLYNGTHSAFEMCQFFQIKPRDKKNDYSTSGPLQAYSSLTLQILRSKSYFILFLCRCLSFLHEFVKKNLFYSFAVFWLNIQVVKFLTRFVFVFQLIVITRIVDDAYQKLRSTY